jgi:hypothetical protein
MSFIEDWVVTLLYFLQLPSIVSINIKLLAIIQEKDIWMQICLPKDEQFNDILYGAGIAQSV